MQFDLATLHAQLALVTRALASLEVAPTIDKLSADQATRQVDRAFADEVGARIALKATLDLFAEVLDDDQATALAKAAQAALGDGGSSLMSVIDAHDKEIRGVLDAAAIDSTVLDRALKQLAGRDVVVEQRDGTLSAHSTGFGIDVAPRPIQFKAGRMRSFSPSVALAGHQSPADVFGRAMALAAGYREAVDLSNDPVIVVGDWLVHGVTDAADQVYARALDRQRATTVVTGADAGIGFLIALLVIITVIIVGAILAFGTASGSTVSIVGSVLLLIGLVALAVWAVAFCAAATAGTCAVVAVGGLAVPISTCGAVCT